MHGAFIYCEHCKTFSEGHGIGFDSSSTVTVIDNLESCPRCGHTARILDGTYSAVDDVMTFVAANRWSADRMAEFAAEVRETWKTRGPEAAAAVIAEREPELAKKWGRKLTSPEQLTLLLTAISTAAALVGLGIQTGLLPGAPTPPAVNITVNQLNQTLIECDPTRPSDPPKPKRAPSRPGDSFFKRLAP
ncbi:hypothetical protein [Terrabacter sp. NPDC000476]|uniref:hypothetical protein n=1 Tax=Terrabacter sp. NPDC000476 TaxID=3154258 RepID=UPI003316BECF